MAKHRSRKRRGRPGVAAPAAKPRQTTSRPQVSPPVGGTPAADAQGRPGAHPDGSHDGSTPTLPTWLMLAATLWSGFILWRVIFRWDDGAAGSDAGAPWVIVVIVVATILSSLAAFWLLRTRSTTRARIPLWITVVLGIQGVLASALAIISLVLLWRARRQPQWWNDPQKVSAARRLARR